MNQINSIVRYTIFGFVSVLSFTGWAQELFDATKLNNPAVNGAEIAEKLETVEVYEYKFPEGDRIVLKNGFRKSGFVNADDWLKIKDSVDVLGVDIVYSKYPIRDGAYHEIYPLLFNRIKATLEMDPALNNDAINWRKIWQTHCENNDQVNELYHGVVIWYAVRKKPNQPDQNNTEISKDTVPRHNDTTTKNPTESTSKTPSGPDSFVVEFILNHPDTPDSIKQLVVGKSPFDRAKIVRSYFLEEKRKLPEDATLNNPIMRTNYMYAVEGFMSQFPTVNPVVGEVLDRHPEWRKKIVVNDWTGSMYGYGAQVLLWHLMNIDSSGIQSVTLFNDGDNKPTERKKIGKTGGIYTGQPDNVDAIMELFSDVMHKGGGGDGPENDIEAILAAMKEDPDAEIILIADNTACVRDIELADQIGRPVRIVLCGYDPNSGVNPDYVYLAHATGGGIYTIEEDIEQIAVNTDQNGTIIAYRDKRMKLSSPQCFDAVFGKAEGRRFDLKKARFNKKQVRVLDASGEHLEKIPAYVYKMKSIQSLDLSRNDLTEITDDILSLDHLSILQIPKNDLTRITDSIDQLVYLEYFYANENKLTKVPEGLYRLDFLKEAVLSKNELSTVKEFESDVLERVNLDGNQLSALPSFAGNTNLIEVSAAYNNLTSFPANISMGSLKELNLSFNQIENLPMDLTPYKKLKSLNLQGNPITEGERIRIRQALFNVDLTF